VSGTHNSDPATVLFSASVAHTPLPTSANKYKKFRRRMVVFFSFVRSDVRRTTDGDRFNRSWPPLRVWLSISIEMDQFKLLGWSGVG
jgi:hypothetical protein